MGEIWKPYIPGKEEVNIPLSRLLPEYRPGMLSAWLDENIPQGSWILEPAGSHPLSAIEAAHAGYRVLLTVNNPIIRFMVEMFASAPKEKEFLQALADFDMIRRGGEGITSQLDAIYRTQCNQCKHEIPVRAFIWRKGEYSPYAKDYSCPFCGDEGERNITTFDRGKVLQYNSDLHRARAVERAMLGIEATQEMVEETLHHILPRQLYFIFTLLNRLEGYSNLSKRNISLLTALCISMLDQANVLWQNPITRTRPRQLNFPPQFRENNLWNIFQAAFPEWLVLEDPVPLSHYPILPEEDYGICLFHGRLRDFITYNKKFPVKATVFIIPRPNQAFWSFSALWSAWLWGKERAISMQGVFDRKRFDWQWHAHALSSLFASINSYCEPSYPMYTVAPEINRGFLTSIVAAAIHSRLHWGGVAFQESEQVCQLNFLTSLSEDKQVESDFQYKDLLTELKQFLLDRNQPADYITMSLIIMQRLYKEVSRENSIEEGPRVCFQRISSIIGEILTNRDAWTIYTQGSSDIENWLWWVKPDQIISGYSLVDTIERNILSFFSTHREFNEDQIYLYLYQKHAGVDTPSKSTVQLILESYGESSTTNKKRWHLHPHDLPDARKRDLDNIMHIIEHIGTCLGFTVTYGFPIVWNGTNEIQETYRFFPITTCMISPYAYQVISENHTLGKPIDIFVIPGSRSKLFLHKLERDPRLEKVIETKWKVMKFRHIRQFAERNDLNINLWRLLLDRDPIRWEDAIQLNIFE